MNKILELAKSANLPLKDIKDISEYLEHREWGLAFEILCSALKEYKISISNVDYNELKKLGEKMEMDKKLWEDIPNDKLI